jgi:hypothetical protein
MSTGNISATVKDIFTGSPIQGALVEILNGSIMIDSQTTDSDGVFTTGALQLGSYKLQVTKPPYQQISKEVLVSQDLVTIADIYIQPLNLYGKTSSGNFQPINTNNINGLILSSLSENACRIGKYYGATTGAQSIPVNSYFVIELSNPANSGRTVHLGNISGGMTFASVIDLLKNGTLSSGTTVSTTKWNYGFADDSNTVVKWETQTTDPTTGGILQTSIIQNGIPMVVEMNGGIIIPPNYTMALRTYNKSSDTAQQIAITITWWEESL